MMKSADCLARAVELEDRLATAAPDMQDEYRRLAAQWRILADIAAYAERSKLPD